MQKVKISALLLIFLASCNGFASQPERTQLPLNTLTSTPTSSPSPTPTPTVSLTVAPSPTATLAPTSIPPVPTPPELISEAAPTADLEASVSALEPGAPCPITPIQEDFWTLGGPVAGAYPIWIASRGQTKFSNLGPKVLPPASGELLFVEGHYVKTHVFVHKDVEGDLRVSGRQLDGDSLVYFPLHDQFTRIDSETLQLLGMPADFTIVENAHIPTQFPTPPDKIQNGIGPLYVNPGCYQLTATIAEYTVSIVFEILDE